VPPTVTCMSGGKIVREGKKDPKHMSEIGGD